MTGTLCLRFAALVLEIQYFLTNESRSIKRNAIASKFVYEVYYV